MIRTLEGVWESAQRAHQKVHFLRQCWKWKSLINAQHALPVYYGYSITVLVGLCFMGRPKGRRCCYLVCALSSLYFADYDGSKTFLHSPSITFWGYYSHCIVVKISPFSCLHFSPTRANGKRACAPTAELTSISLILQMMVYKVGLSFRT